MWCVGMCVVCVCARARVRLNVCLDVRSGVCACAFECVFGCAFWCVWGGGCI